MKFEAPMLVVNDINLSRKFYCDIFKVDVISDFGANITFTGGFSLQTRESWKEFIHMKDEDIVYHGNDMELYFEEDDMDTFLAHLNTFHDIKYVHEVQEHAWGQRVVRFYDPDFHILEVGESMEVVCQRFLKQGMSVEDVQKKTMYSIEFVRNCIPR